MSELLLQNRFEPLLECRGLALKGDGEVLLDEVSFGLGREELLGVIGPARAASRALLDACSGLRPPAAGAIAVSGRDLAGAPARTFLEHGIVRGFARPALPAAGNVIDFLGFAVAQGERRPWWRQLGPARRTARSLRRDLLEILEFVGIARLADYPLAGLGLHHRRLLDIARALLQRPRALVLERPFEGLDAPARTALTQLIPAIVREGVAVLLADDDVGALARLCPRLLVLHRGRVIADGTPDSVGSAPLVLEAFTGSRAP